MAFSSKRRLTVDAWSPEDPVAAAESKTIDGLKTMIKEAELAVSHEQAVRGGGASGRAEAAVVETEGGGVQRHRGCGEVKIDLRSEYNGASQCIGGMAAQVAQNWTLDDEADSLPTSQKRNSQEGDEVVIGGPKTAASSSSGVKRSDVEEGKTSPRVSTVFGVFTDLRTWLVLHMVATRAVSGDVTASVTSSGFLRWRAAGKEGSPGLVRALCGVALPDVDATNDDEWKHRAGLLKHAMLAHASTALERCGLGQTGAAAELKVRPLCPIGKLMATKQDLL